ncbi:MAG: multidrug ABC transporter ATP-binding protein [Clostridiales bacterium 43-6]|nr:MAG: multidrug ABC transporter ATP-binding protein [Clostridiales bacterium 43-6]
MFKLIKYFKSYILYILLIVGFLLVQAWSELSLPEYMANIVSKGIAVSNTNYIYEAGVQMLLLSLLSIACATVVGFLASRVAAAFSRDIRSDIFQKITNFSNTEFDKFSTASLITRSTNDITQIQMFAVMMLRLVFFAPIMGIGGVLKAIDNSEGMGPIAWVIIVAVASLVLLILYVILIALPKFKLIQKLVDKLNLVTRESLTGIMVIRSFNTQSHEESKFEKANMDLTRTNLFVGRVMAIMMPMMMMILYGVSMSVIWVGAYYADNMIELGNMLAFIAYAMQIIFAFIMVSMVFFLLPRASVSANRVHEVLTTEPSIVDPAESASMNENVGIVEFKNVSFRYPGAEDDTLKNISFTALPGQTTAFIGSTGSGKSTLINLIPRLYDATDGDITVGGVSIRNMTQETLRSYIGYISQKGILFSGTIESNLKYADENASDELMTKAAEVAQVLDFIESSENKFGESIAQGGTNVSGGQKQRLSIARALVKNSPIYIFDDSFSALDFKTDSNVRKALKEYTTDATVLIVAQRISTIMNADQIIVLDDGKIVGKGTHRELLDSCEVYKDIATSQLSKEELN